MVQAPSLPDGFRWRSKPMPQVVRDLAADCGLTIGPTAGRVVVQCPRCRADAYVLRGTLYGWTCRRCHGQRWSQFEVSMATYAMGLRIGYRGRPMMLRHCRLAAALQQVALTGRSIKDVWLLAQGAALLQYSPHWQRRRRDGLSRQPFSPIMLTCGPRYIAAVIDSMLHPAAFFERFARA
jgi:hypothetical protein